MKAWQWVIVVMLASAVPGCGLLKTKPDTPAGTRIFKAVRTDKPPKIDGKLDDAVWQKAEVISDYYAYNSDELAKNQSVARILYDDAHLYIGVKCMLTKGRKPKGAMHPHDSGKVWGDDCVEIMIDPGNTRSDYYQLVMNAYGATFDCSRLQGGAHEDDGWNGEWVGEAHIGDGYYSIEMAIPYHNLGMTGDIGYTWGINLCREGKEPAQLSTVIKQGTFNKADTFPVLTGLNVDFRKYSFKIGPAAAVLDPSARKPMIQFNMPVTNLSGKTRKVKISSHRKGAAEPEVREVELAPNATITFPLERLPAKPILKGHSDIYLVDGQPMTEKIVVSDAETRTVLSAQRVKQPLFVQMMQVAPANPWQAHMPSGKTPTVALEVRLSLPRALRAKGTLEVTLTSRRTGKPMAQKAVKAPRALSEVRFDTRAIPWGAYDARIAFKNARGQEMIASTKFVTVLPGGPQRIRVLNNLVSELMDAGDRGLIWDKEIDFMNPRDGWCFFVLSGGATVRIDSVPEPVMAVREGGKAAEAMRWLPAGRHTLHIEGRPSVLIVRAIPELIHCYHPSTPHIRAHGPHDWKRLSKDVLPSCNLIVGSVRENEMRLWRAQGKRWITSKVVPGLIEKEFFSADRSYKHWQGSLGYSHPLMDGIIADEFLTSGSNEQYLAWTESVIRLHEDPKFKGRIFYPWCGGIYGIEGGRIFMNAIYKFGWHQCFERYLAEQPTEQAAWNFIDEVLVGTAKAWDTAVPGSARDAIVTLGYLSHPTESCNTYAAVDYKVYMDMQFSRLANHAVFFGTYGIMEYTSSYADEETVRWAGKLYRHYCIEGRSERLSKDPYALTHILNPDFYDGTKHWTVAPAEKGSVKVDKYEGYGCFQCRYQRGGQGDVFRLTKRSAKKPNVISQTIKNLDPGRVYSMKLITADYDHLVKEVSRKQMHAVTIKLDGVDILPGPRNSFQYIFPNCYAHKLGKFGRDYRYWMNYYWRVFRATGSTAKLTISDWKDDPAHAGPGGPIGQKLMYNMIEVQPYLVE